MKVQIKKYRHTIEMIPEGQTYKTGTIIHQGILSDEDFEKVYQYLLKNDE